AGGQQTSQIAVITDKSLSESYLSIVLDNVSLRLGEQYILKNINLDIPHRKTLAFVGPSGSGKTSLINIICGLLQPTSGQIRVSDERKNLHQRIGYITQEPVIFNDTVYNNITFWAEKTPENLVRFKDVVAKTDLVSFIDQLPIGLDSMLGTDGMNISGGQKQRIAIARELFRDIEILIMDEATSSLDSETERTIQHQIERLQGQYTFLIIAHRLSTVHHADQIVMLQNGEIVEKGTFNELSERSKTFQNMIKMQQI
ncbi:MAG TPA: ABC transporter ATP-binding protein, partial [Bacteroidetes bacterium]|nr:ABC transporter ATP-binding protein [Bacteroidota bacterium]